MSEEKFDILKRIDIGVQRGVAKALSEHKRLGQPIVVWRDGKIVEIPPEEIVVPTVDKTFPDEKR